MMPNNVQQYNSKTMCTIKPGNFATNINILLCYLTVD